MGSIQIENVKNPQKFEYQNVNNIIVIIMIQSIDCEWQLQYVNYQYYIASQI